jgi:hypothetical protein
MYQRGMNREAHCPSSRYVTGFDLNEARIAAQLFGAAVATAAFIA